ncbi:MAG: hypothetical protein CMJ18_22950 [Phycisphaeraceae bacterium]|nr:hypothetical protein [Phycisphaeraceae bacterium]
MTWTLSAFADEAGPTADEQIRALADAGICQIDIRGIEGHNIVALPLDLAEGIRAKLDAAGVSVCMFGSPIGKIDIADDFEPELEKLDHLGRLGPLFECRAVRLFSYFNKNEAPADDWRRESLERLRRLRDRAGELGLVLYHENERKIYGDRCPEIELLAAELRDGDRFRLIFDFDNFNQSGDDVWDNWCRLRDDTDAFHLKDSNDRSEHVPIGQGEGCVRRILADALAAGWSGPLSLEPHLKHSAAVTATGPHGKAHQSFTSLTEAECFAEAARCALEMMGELSAPVK